MNEKQCKRLRRMYRVSGMDLAGLRRTRRLMQREGVMLALVDLQDKLGPCYYRLRRA